MGTLYGGPVYERVKYRMASPLELPAAQAGSIGDADLGYFRYAEAAAIAAPAGEATAAA